MYLFEEKINKIDTFYTLRVILRFRVSLPLTQAIVKQAHFRQTS